MSEKLNIANIASGALVEQFEIELQKVLENIADPNTDAKKVRKIKIEMTLKANEQRNIAVVNCQTKSTLIPANAIETSVFIDKDNRGNIVAAELLKGSIPGQESIDFDTGEILDQKVVSFSKN